MSHNYYKYHPKNCNELQKIIIDEIKLQNDSDTLNLNSIDTSEVKSMHVLFKIRSLDFDTIDISDWDFSNVEDMSEMFQGRKKLKHVKFSSSSTPRLENMEKMFFGCTNLEDVDLSNFDTSKVTNMGVVFCACPMLKSVGDISSWDVENVTTMTNIFNGCESLTYLPIENWKPKSLKELWHMFNRVPAKTNLKSWGPYIDPSMDGYETMFIKTKMKASWWKP